jgi:signal transduction histidine kinase
LVERALLTAKAVEGRLDVVPTDIDVSSLVADLEDAYAVLAEERGIAFAKRIDPGLSSRVDANLLRQILHNLLGNAVRHGAGTVRVRARRSGNGKTVVVSISNRVEIGRDSGGGVGIGLRLVRSLASAMENMKFRFRLTEGAAVARLVLPALETWRNS